MVIFNSYVKLPEGIEYGVIKCGVFIAFQKLFLLGWEWAYDDVAFFWPKFDLDFSHSQQAKDRRVVLS